MRWTSRPVLAGFRLVLSKFFCQHTMCHSPRPPLATFRLEISKFFCQRTMHRLDRHNNKIRTAIAVLTILITLLSLHSRSCSAHDSFYFFLASHGCISRSCHSECSVSCTIIYSHFCIACCHKTIDKA